MKINPIRFLLSPFLFLFLFQLNAQEWKYFGTKDNLNAASDTWVDEHGNSYHNITQFSKRGSSGGIHSKHLLILDKKGRFNGMVKVNECRNRAVILPFSDGNYLINGPNCRKGNNTAPDSRVLNKEGRLIAQGEGFSLHRTAYVRTEKGYTIFTSRSFTSDQPMINIQDIDWDFMSDTDSMDISELKVPGKNIGHDLVTFPVKGTDGRWLMHAFQGTLESRVEISQDYDIVYLTDGKKIFNQFPKDRQDVTIEAMHAYGDGYALMTNVNSKKGLGKAIYLLDKNAEVAKTIFVKYRGMFNRFLIHNDHIFVMSTIYNYKDKSKMFVMHTFDMEGQLITERTLHENDRVFTTTLVPFGESSILLSGSIIPSNEVRYSFVWKLDFDGTKEPTLEAETPINEEEETIEESPIKEASIEELAEDVLSVAVFPNPASIYINFSLENNNADNNTRYGLEVFSMDGKSVHQDIFNGQFYELNLSDFPSGTFIYHVRNLNDKKEFLTGKFVKQR